MKRLLSIVLASVMLFSLAACTSTPVAPDTSSATDVSNEAPAASDYKIAIITGTVSQGEEEFRAAENM